MDFTPGSKIRFVHNEDLQKEEYRTFWEWYFKIHTPFQLEQYKIQYYEYLEQNQIIQSFPHWYVQNITPTESQINVIEKIQQTWVIQMVKTLCLSIHQPSLWSYNL